MLGVDGTFDHRVWVLRCEEYPEHDSMIDCFVESGMHKPSFDVSSSLPHGFSMTPSTCHTAAPQGPDRMAVTLCVHVQVVHHAPNR